ncbi:MAG TPA: twin-arginine translocase TatA/TatE family subunit [Bacteroidia bacterium]|nr:twin-arginine translocase TatA/TatE family subunit [Bacteroidia bacterium]
MLNLVILGLIGGLGGTEIILILVVVLLFFGGKRIPELAKGLGKGIREFKDASSGKSDEPKEIPKKD